MTGTNLIMLLPVVVWLITFAESRVIRGRSFELPLVDPIRKVMEGVNDHAKKMEEAMNRDDEEKTMMDPIEIFRAEMCLHRDALIKHEKCLRWMIEVCQHETSGAGSCKALQKYLVNVCMHDEDEKASREACMFAKKLGVGEKMEEEAKEETVTTSEPTEAPKPSEEPEAETPAPEEEKEPAPKEETTTAEPATTAKPVETKEEPEVAAEKEPEKVEARKVEPTTTEKPAPLSSATKAPVAPFPKEVDYSKKERALPDQGYDEHSTEKVEYNDMKNHAKDWQEEWPQTKESEASSYKRICAEQPDNAWCKENHPPAPKKVEKSWFESIFGR
mmetsp:Transcript_4424/g.8608  ORF Transcript_4424/g.8608 Transcript_4424/m.8608 type:complete len:331 (-) Transcript_4424:44-1036(-)